MIRPYTKILICIAVLQHTFLFVSAQTGTRDDAGLQGNAGATSGFFETESPVNYPAGAHSWWHLLDVRHSNSMNNYAMQFSGSFFDQQLWFRKTNSNAQQSWSRVLTENNGFLNGSNLSVRTHLGQSFFVGLQMGAGYSFEEGIFKAVTENANGTSNYYYDGFTAGTRKFSVRADGKGYFASGIGIGTENPSGHLQVLGESYWDGPTKFLLTNNAADYGRTSFIITGRYQDQNDGWSFGSAARNAIVFAQNESESGQNKGAVGDEKYSIQLEGNSKSLGFLSKQLNNNPSMVLAQNGFVGIGATQPRTKLDVWGGMLNVTGDDFNGTAVVAAKNGQAFYGNNTYANGLVVSANGNIGIGTGESSLSSRLEVRGGALALGTHIVSGNTDGYLSMGNVTQSSTPNVQDWYYRTTMLLSGQDYSTIGFHDSGNRVDFIRAGNGDIELGYNGGWGNANIKLPDGVWNASGNVGIGLSNPSEKLTVNGKIKAREVRVSIDGMPDYVFEPGYERLSLAEIEKYIKVHKHLPEIPSAAEAEKNGLELGEMNKLLLKKIEELTLHLIEKDAELKKMASDQQDTKTLVKELAEKIKSIERSKTNEK